MSEKKPKWLQALEAQSWQAELIASGLAIYGSLSLGSYLDYFSQWAVLNFNERTLSVLLYLSIYVYAAHSVLVISFITHLILRILWAGILGLSSVFPKGINTETNVYPDYFKENLKKDFTDLSAYSLELDRICSLIFSILCAMVIVLLNIAIWLAIYLIVSFFLLKFLPVSIVNFIGYFFVALLLIVSIVGGLMTQGKLKNSRLSKKYSYKLIFGMSKVIYLIGNKSYNYITQTIRTNITSRSFFIGMFAILVISMLFSMPRFINALELYKPSLFANNSPDGVYVSKDNYQDKIEDKLILQPFIQSEVIKDNFLNLYIPRFEREQPVVDSLCVNYVWNDSISKIKNRKLRAEHRKACAKQYYTIFIDDVVIENIEYQFRDKLYNNRIGYQAFIPIDSLSRGSHVLKIESRYIGEGKNYVRSIPFYKAK